MNLLHQKYCNEILSSLLIFLSSRWWFPSTLRSWVPDFRWLLIAVKQLIFPSQSRWGELPDFTESNTTGHISECFNLLIVFKIPFVSGSFISIQYFKPLSVAHTILSNKFSAAAVSKILVILLTFKFCCPPFPLQLTFLSWVLILWLCTENFSEGNVKKMLSLPKEACISQSEAFKSEKRGDDWFNDFSSSQQAYVSVTDGASEISWFPQHFHEATVFLGSVINLFLSFKLKLIISAIIFKTSIGYVQKSLSNL